jgi:hypothetical protein
MTRGREDGATRVDATTCRHKTTREQLSVRTTRGRYDKRQPNNQQRRWDNKRTAQWEDKERTRGWYDERTRCRRNKKHNNQPEQNNKRVAQWEDNKRAVRQEGTQQPAGAMRQQEGRKWENNERARGWHDERTRGRRNKRQHNNQPAQDDKRAMKWEDNERVVVQQEAMQQSAGEMRQQEGGAVKGRWEDERAGEVVAGVECKPEWWGVGEEKLVVGNVVK